MKRGLWVVLAVAVLFISGCFYSRVQQVKRQFGEFDKYFEIIETNDKIYFVAKEPVLFSEDVIYMMGYEPVVVAEDGNNLQFSYVLEKHYSGEEAEDGNFDIEFQMFFEDDLLKQVGIDRRLFAVIPKEIMVGIFKSLGSAKVNIAKREVKGGKMTAENPHFPDANEVIELLGKPYDIKGGIYEYQYIKMNPEKKVYDNNDILPVTFEFDENRKMISCESYLTGGRFYINFGDVNSLK